MQIKTDIIAKTSSGIPVLGFSLININGNVIRLTNWGARWIEAQVPDRKGCLGNVLVTPENVLSDQFYMGAVVGRFANRIAGARMVIDGKEYKLDKNDGENTNHGGNIGFDKRLWRWELLDDGVRFLLVSDYGEGGYPGTVYAVVEYHWDDDNRLTICYGGTTDYPTYLNMTNHAYFDLGCSGGKLPGAVYRHELLIPSHYILDTTSDFIPTGEKTCVDGTPFDFTQAKAIGRDIHADNEQLRWNRGYNHCYVLKMEKSDVMTEAAVLRDPDSGRCMSVATDLPSVLLYTAGYYPVPGCAVCLETQYYPDTPSHADFPSCLLRPGDIYSNKTIFAFDID